MNDSKKIVKWALSLLIGFGIIAIGFHFSWGGYILTPFFVLNCMILIIVVLLQSGKAADLAGAFGGMGSQTVFGPRGSATVLSKATTIAAALFMVTSLSLSIMATRSGAGIPAIFDKKPAPAKTNGQQPPPVGSTVPIQVTPSVNGEKSPTQTIPMPIQATPTLPQPPPQDKKK
jgi:preprotein translocase subunit SecG